MNSELVCSETLVASLREPSVLDGRISRTIYITSRPLGSEGATGVVRRGDLASDPLAKTISFERDSQAYEIGRNGNPPPPPERVPDGDIGALLRSAVRMASAFGPVFVTVTDIVTDRGIETIRKVIPGKALELYCQHGPHPSARGVPFTQDDLAPSVSWLAIASIGFLLLLSYVFYAKFIRRRSPPTALPDNRPFFVDSSHHDRSVRRDDIISRDVESVLARMRR